MKQGLSRKKARACIVLLGAGAAVVLLGLIAGWDLVTVAGLAVLVVAVFIQPTKCPRCGKRLVGLPQWSKKGNIACPKCGGLAFYDDEPEEAAECINTNM